jgi:hypothetical protein
MERPLGTGAGAAATKKGSTETMKTREKYIVEKRPRSGRGAQRIPERVKTGKTSEVSVP